MTDVVLHPDGIMIAADGQSANVTVTENMRWVGKAGKDMTIQTSVFSFRTQTSLMTPMTPTTLLRFFEDEGEPV